MRKLILFSLICLIIFLWSFLHDKQEYYMYILLFAISNCLMTFIQYDIAMKKYNNKFLYTGFVLLVIIIIEITRMYLSILPNIEIFSILWINTIANIFCAFMASCATIAVSLIVGEFLALDRLNLIEKEKIKFKKRVLDEDGASFEDLEKELEEKYRKILAERQEKHKKEIVDLKSKQLFQMEQYKQKVHKERVEGLQFREQKM